MASTLSDESMDKLFKFEGSKREDPTFDFKRHHLIVEGMISLQHKGEPIELI
jgi:hypothetical protein